MTEAVAAARSEVARSVMLCDVTQALRMSGHVTSCAWCRRYHFGDGWYAREASDLVVRLASTRKLTHGVCPECFDKVAPPGVEYPADASTS